MPEEIAVPLNEVKWLVSHQTMDLYSELAGNMEAGPNWMRDARLPDSTVVRILPSEEDCKDCSLNDLCRDMERAPGYLFTTGMRPGQAYQLGYLKLLHEVEFRHAEKVMSYRGRGIRTEHFYMEPLK